MRGAKQTIVTLCAAVLAMGALTACDKSSPTTPTPTESQMMSESPSDDSMMSESPSPSDDAMMSESPSEEMMESPSS